MSASGPSGPLVLFWRSKLFSSNLPLLLVCILENENIVIVSSSFIVIHTLVHFKSSSLHLILLNTCAEDCIYLSRPLHMFKRTQKIS